ncbi:MAG TPA: SMP-30/gluconolactonase/LRE family protein [Burkholderiaceae bacterium]|nr:SMP-30/gluconolactonase/LRE family protein [Burkholderiaceae bacterium]
MSRPRPPQLLSEVRTLWPAGATLGEGTCWSPGKQALYWVDILEHRLHRYTPATGRRETWTFDDTISAVAERETASGLLVTLRRGFAFFDPDAPDPAASLVRLEEPEPEREGNRFNDGKCDARGRFWGGTMDFDCEAPTGALYRYDGCGRCERVLDARFPVTNGPTWAADGRTMYFNDTDRRLIYAFDFDMERGTLGGQRVWLKFGREDGYPDGMTTDADGRLWVAHWGASCVTCHDPVSADVLLRVPLPTPHITNVCFGGPDLRTLYITSARYRLPEERLRQDRWAGALFCVETDAQGMPPARFAG